MEPEASLSKRLKTSLRDWICSAESCSMGVFADWAEWPDETEVLIGAGRDWEGGGLVSLCLIWGGGG